MSAARTCLAAVALLGTACAHPRPASDLAPEATADVLTLEVDNRNWSDVLIYVLHDGSRTRFIEVTATKSVSQPIPEHLVGAGHTVQFVVHRIGGRDDRVNLAVGPRFRMPSDDYTSPMVSLRTGSVVMLTLESDLQRSSVGVW